MTAFRFKHLVQFERRIFKLINISIQMDLVPFCLSVAKKLTEKADKTEHPLIITYDETAKRYSS